VKLTSAPTVVPGQRLTAAAFVGLLAVFTGLPVQDEIRAQQWHLDFLAIEQVHQVSTGEGVIVGVIDTGVDGGHPDLTGRLLPGLDLTYLKKPNALEDLDGHGTTMAGLIAANGLGIAPGATILPVRSHTDSTGDARDAADGIVWAVHNGATVLCLAFANPEPNDFLNDAVRFAIANDVVVIAAVGNSPNDTGLLYPAAYPGVVGAAGVDRDGNHADVSVISPAADLAAPAVDIMTPRSRTVFPNGYSPGTGTSDATAIIAGVAALIRSKYPDLSAEDVINRMLVTADDRGAPGRDDEYGYGIVNPLAALTADIPPLNPPADTRTAATIGVTSPDIGPPTLSFIAVSASLAVACVSPVVFIIVLMLIRHRRRP
jgi:type VII secretion-associated serine protease mycosin